VAVLGVASPVALVVTLMAKQVERELHTKGAIDVFFEREGSSRKEGRTPSKNNATQGRRRRRRGRRRGRGRRRRARASCVSSFKFSMETGSIRSCEAVNLSHGCVG
jgi:hypothetical protein